MSTVGDMPKPDVKLPSTLQTTVAGIVLSNVTLISGLVTYVILGVFVILPLTGVGANFIESLPNRAQSLISNPVNALWGAVLWLMIAEWLIFVPTVFVGGSIALTMRRLAERHRLNRWSIAIAGSLIGLAVGLAADRWYYVAFDDYAGYPIVMGIIGIAWGALSSLLLLAWFKRKMR